MTEDSATRSTPAKVDSKVPQTARVWNYWLGGKDNYAVDRAVGDEINAAFPEMAELARGARAFLSRAVRFLAGEAGIRQFLDVGTGLPTAENTHEIAQRVAPEAKVVYVDNDPLVLAHARALLTSTPEGVTQYIDADARDTDRVLAQAAETLDLRAPVALSMLGVLAHLDPYEEALAVVQRLLAALPSGSYLVVSDSSSTDPGVVEAARIWNQSANPQYHLRTREQITGYFTGLEILEPGLVNAPFWRPRGGGSDTTFPPTIYTLCAVGRKP